MSTTTILIADDDVDLVHALSVRCRELGLRVLTAHDGLTALTTAHNEHPQLICLDFHMPSGTGLSVCEMLSGDPELASTPVILLTGKGNSEMARRCHSMCVYYVPKCADVWARIGPLVVELLEHLKPKRGTTELTNSAATAP